MTLSPLTQIFHDLHSRDQTSVQWVCRGIWGCSQRERQLRTGHTWQRQRLLRHVWHQYKRGDITCAVEGAVAFQALQQVQHPPSPPPWQQGPPLPPSPRWISHIDFSQRKRFQWEDLFHPTDHSSPPPLLFQDRWSKSWSHPPLMRLLTFGGKPSKSV